MRELREVARARIRADPAGRVAQARAAARYSGIGILARDHRAAGGQSRRQLPSHQERTSRSNSRGRPARRPAPRRTAPPRQARASARPAMDVDLQAVSPMRRCDAGRQWSRSAGARVRPGTSRKPAPCWRRSRSRTERPGSTAARPAAAIAARPGSREPGRSPVQASERCRRLAPQTAASACEWRSRSRRSRRSRPDRRKRRGWSVDTTTGSAEPGPCAHPAAGANAQDQNAEPQRAASTRLCHSDTAPAQVVPLARPPERKKHSELKGVTAFDTWASDCYYRM